MFVLPHVLSQFLFLWEWQLGRPDSASTPFYTKRKLRQQVGIFTNCLRRFGNSWDRKGSLDMESLKKTSTPDLAMSNSWAEGNQSASDNEEKGGLSYLDLPPWMTSLPGAESPTDTRRKGWSPVRRSAASPQALLALPPQRARSRRQHLSLSQVRRLSGRTRI